MWAYDLICIGFRIADDGSGWEIDEKMPGYNAVLAAAEKAFPGMRTDWFWEVAVPAFERNLTTLWGESKMAALWPKDE
jgi:hypothetical protein